MNPKTGSLMILCVVMPAKVRKIYVLCKLSAVLFWIYLLFFSEYFGVFTDKMPMAHVVLADLRERIRELIAENLKRY